MRIAILRGIQRAAHMRRDARAQRAHRGAVHQRLEIRARHGGQARHFLLILRQQQVPHGAIADIAPKLFRKARPENLREAGQWLLRRMAIYPAQAPGIKTRGVAAADVTLDQRDRRASLRQVKGRGQADKAAADDQDIRHGRNHFRC